MFRKGGILAFSTIKKKTRIVCESNMKLEKINLFSRNAAMLLLGISEYLLHGQYHYEKTF